MKSINLGRSQQSPAAMSIKITATKLQDALRPQAKGEPVNVHVVEFVRQPQPDYDAMQKILSGEEKPRAPEAAISEPAAD